MPNRPARHDRQQSPPLAQQLHKEIQKPKTIHQTRPRDAALRGFERGRDVAQARRARVRPSLRRRRGPKLRAERVRELIEGRSARLLFLPTPGPQPHRGSLLEDQGATKESGSVHAQDPLEGMAEALAAMFKEVESPSRWQTLEGLRWSARSNRLKKPIYC